MDMTANVLDEVNASHQTFWQLRGRLSGGYQNGVYLVADLDGRRAVLKWTDARDWAPTVLAAEAVVVAARAQGWPTPAWLAVGETEGGFPYQVQEYVEGTTQEMVSHDWLDLVLPVIAGQAGLGRDGMRNWSSYDHDVVYTDLSGNRAAVARACPAGAHLSEVITRLTRDHEGVVLPAGDLVHGDLNPGNVLIDSGRVAALIDVEAVGCGTRLHDLAGLLLYAALWGRHDVQDRLIAECRRIAAPGWMEVCLSSVTVDLLAFGVRHWPPEDLASLCHLASELVDQIAA